MKSVSSGWSFLRDSSQLRAAIQFRMEQTDMKIIDVAKILNTHPDRVSKYLRGVKPSLTNYQLVQLAGLFGIEVELTVKFLPSTPTS